ncbi:putative transmembrane protein [Bacteroides phage crAss001]|uniref:Cargo protein 1 n=1 Tax=Bacteroides phage crAss001 TaxID=2301731 RepID=CARG1_BPCA1|nr:putative transmembrane protein [Bacteroides phage crAss001]A0A385DV85.1 RecName: Full=Cargo protein 1; Short=C1; AltName: Full=Gene product 45; Short=gp45 [Bacteroides phage crAss001]7QOG_M Chain M, Cargo protein 1 gp45 [Bacteroides phage crAss001]7QOG_N Chain N, Cargo protein 1 gp45 [Bacteroides phage crAss001]7QOI_GK Chain GK, Cargo protein 1 gp45 [Bacteroides phage crAss001]7QOI_GL Chain GL, Cargo protein 1 gp45 [Bacteroides phage crAss001]7QOI_GM Chain GM, Cargo protein 1 gp45 [Bactero
MAKKKIKRRGKMPPNIFDTGGQSWGQQSSGQFSNAFKGENLGNSIGSIGGAVGGIAQAGISNAQIADTSGIEAQNKAQKNMVVGASSNDDLMSEWGSWNKVKDDYSWKDVRGGSTGQRVTNTIGAAGQGAAAGASVGGPIGAIVGGVVGLGSAIGGWLGGNRKAKRKAKKLNKEAKEANERALTSFETRADNIDTQNDFNMLANFSAYGGPLEFGSGAIGYEFDNRYLNNQEMSAVAKQRLTSLPNSFQALPEMNTYNAFAEGGGLSREKNYGSKKKPYPSVPSGDFAGPHRSYPIPTKADARDALRLAGLHGNESVRRKVLAKYPSLKAFGGSLFDSVVGNNFNQSFTQGIQGMFQQEPEQTVQAANIAKDGGDIKIKEKNKGKFTAYCGGKVTEACIRKGKNSSNPTTRKRATFAQNARNWNAFGGWLNTQGGDFTNGVTFINEGGSHEENPYQGIQIGVDPEGAPNLVEQGEVVYDDYVFSDRMEIPDDIRKEYKLRGKTFAKAAKSAQRESEERPNDPLSTKGLQAAMERIATAQEEARQRKEAHREGNEYPSMFAYGGDTNPYGLALEDPMSVEELEALMVQSGETGEIAPEGNNGNRQTWTRYAPIIGSGLASLSDLFSKPDYDSADLISGVDLGAEAVGYAPIGNYLSYRPLDRDFYINKMNQQAAATRRGLMNTSGGNRLNAQAGILAADYNYGQNMGNLARQAEEYNQQLRERVEAFNRGTNMFNTETGLKASMFNAESRNAAKRARLGQATTVAQLRQGIKDQDAARRSANITNFLQGLGDMGWENEQANWLDTLAKSGVLKMNTKGEYTGGTKKAKGGKVRTKKKKGLTYG